MTDSSEKPTTADEQAGLEMKKARDEAMVSQKAMAAHLGMTQQNYHKYEAGKQRMLKSVYDDTIAFCASVVLANGGSPLAGLSEMAQVTYSPPLSKEIIRQAVEDLKSGISKLEKLT